MPRITQNPPQPPRYHSSEQVCVAIALAYSSFHNPRGLEKMWSSAWNETFSGLVAQYNGLFTVHAEWPMFLQSLVVKDLQLRQRFAENNLDYHDETSREYIAEDSTTSALDVLGELSITSTLRQSARISEAKSKAEDDKVRAHVSMIKALWKERDQLVLEREREDIKRKQNAKNGTVGGIEDIYGDEDTFFDEGVSLESAASIPERGSINWAPDNVINHIGAIKLSPVPENGYPEGRAHFEHRAGRKVYHYCTAVINELKAAPPRDVDTTEYNLMQRASWYLSSAQRDLLEYCVAYFECHRNAKSVIAIAGAGPFWQWACIRREDVPKWNWILNFPLDDVDDSQTETLYDKWDALFDQNGIYTLGTDKSDVKLTEINIKYLHPMLTDGHTPEAPKLTWHTQ